MDDNEMEELQILSEQVSLCVNPVRPGSELDIYPWLRFVNPSSKKKL